MDKRWQIILGLCVSVIIISGCMSQTPQEQAAGDEQQNGLSPQDQPSGQQGQNSQRGPPQEAIDACSGKSANDSCDFTMNGNAVTGYCRSRPNGVLTCFRSNRGPGGMFGNGTQGRFGGGLPQEAVDACAGKSGNDTCQFKMNETMIQGSCRARRSGNMTCIPLNMGQRPNPGGQPGQPQNQEPPAGQGTQDNPSNSVGGN